MTQHKSDFQMPRSRERKCKQSFVMADENWKERVGININYSDNEDDKPVNGDGDPYSSGGIDNPEHEDLPVSPQSEQCSLFPNSGSESSLDAILHEYESYGATPPRTRITRHIRDWKRREKDVNKDCKIIKGFQSLRSLSQKRSTEDTCLSNLPERPESDMDSPDIIEADKRASNKRWLKLLRSSERDYKLGVSRSEPTDHVDSLGSGCRADSVPVVPIGAQPALKVESSNRFLSLASTLVSCRDLHHRAVLKKQEDSREKLHNRLKPFFCVEIPVADSHMTRRQQSKEEDLWQNEVKDLIWLELQAWHANRTPTEQDNYLCESRERVGPLLNEIMKYRFTSDKKCVHTVVGNDPTLQTLNNMCLSMFCQCCIERQNEAIKEVEKLAARLEQAEALFPSSTAFASKFPLYKSEQFVARVKAMWMWLNITKQHRLKILILGKLFTSRNQTSSNSWPSLADDGDSGHGSSQGSSHGSTPSVADFESPAEEKSGKDRFLNPEKKPPSVRFDCTPLTPSTSPSDSANSNASSQDTDEMVEVTNGSYSFALAVISQQICPNSKTNPTPYRLYIEEVLKTKTLRKAVRFLDRLHKFTLERACLTLEKPFVPEDSNTEGEDTTVTSTITDISAKTDTSASSCVWESELRRHGMWSVEMRELNLPSYRSSFLFLAKIPLRLIQAFLVLRLEQQPEHPSALSLRQLMREIKEGIRLAVINKERYLQLVRSAFWDVSKKTMESLEECVSELDESTECIFRVYLTHLQQWCSIVGHDSYQRNMLEEEWAFTKLVAPHIPNGFVVGGGEFCGIARSMLSSAAKDLLETVQKLTENLQNEDNSEFSLKQRTLTFCRELQCLFNDIRDRTLKSVTFAKLLRKDLEPVERVRTDTMAVPCIYKLKNEAMYLCQSIKTTIKNVEKVFDDLAASQEIDARDNEAVLASIRETLHQGYKFGFEYHKEVCKTVTGDMKPKVANGLIDFAKMWMHFVQNRCERGRGVRPRWAYQGLDFLASVCSPINTSALSDKEFEELTKMVDTCLSHIIGKADLVDSACTDISNSRVNSPTPRPRYRISRSTDSSSSRKSNGSVKSDFPGLDGSPQFLKSIPDFLPPMSPMDRVRSSLELLDRKIDAKLRKENLIGCITALHKEDRIHVRIRQVNFSWQRGIKIGSGTFGKVYTAVNNRTGELMAMKELQLQPNDHRAIRRIAEELRIFEGIQHEHLVRYYGAEIHRDEMLIFMEFCEEGTLETLVAATGCGLPEALIRRYTSQLMQAVYALHTHGIVHRDIKSANVFLTNEGNCLKLGDFGSAVKIKAHTTAPGELQGFVGTQAYMAPEVFTRVSSEGHGRAVDIWSVGCVVVEMGSGRRPWAELDSNYQVMFKVGMGEIPSIPSSLSDEGHDFVESCLKYEPQERATAADLLSHTFLKVDGDELMPSISS